VGDDDGVEGFRVFASQIHAPEELAAAQARVDENARASSGENRAIAPRPRRQHCETHHGLSITRMVPFEPSRNTQVAALAPAQAAKAGGFADRGPAPIE